MTVDLDDVDFNYSSDSDDGGDEEHKRLLAAISKLDKRKRVLPSERREPSLQVSEFHLSKESSSDSNAVHLRDLAKSLSVRASHGEIARKLKSAQRKAKTLPKPLEKPAANKIKREVAFENAKEQLSQWDPVVFRNRVSDDLVFPLKSSEVTRINPEDYLNPNQGATELEREIAAVLNDSPSVQKEREEKEEYPLSLEEMIQRRKEIGRLRAQESYRLAKAHRQNKIKSKKFHRFARRERIRNQIKEFEELQQKDPEAALLRLEEIEKERALERVSLRHRSTGQWARNQAVRAKYDRESRQVLSEQLKLSKDLTKKIQIESESSDEEQPDVEENPPSDNPWISQSKTEADVDTFLSGYRQYWEGRSKNSQEKSADSSEVLEEILPQDVEDRCDDESKLRAICEKAVESYSEIHDFSSTGNESSVSKNGVGDDSQSKTKKTKKLKKIQEKKAEKVLNQKKQCRPVTTSSGKWIVSPLEVPSVPITPVNSALNDMFDDLTEKISEKAKKKISIMKQELETKKLANAKPSQNKNSKKKRAGGDDSSSMLLLKKQRVQVDLDEKLDEGDGTEITLKQRIAKNIQIADSGIQKSSTVTELDPNKFIKTGPIRLQTQIPDEITGGDEGLDDSDSERDKHLTISEAFADDDVVADFSQEKEDAIQKNKPEDISLHLPGWGEWAGHNVKPNKRKSKRFVVKMPEAPPRRDENKGNVIINESEDSAARAHLVSELPFPFTSVKDFEASVRAPISNTFIPESAHRKLIKPPVRTKMGAVITPMDKGVLVKRQKK